MKAAIFAAVVLAFAAACGDDAKKQQDAGVIDTVSADGATDASCFTNPTTHYEIINACTAAQKIYKNSHPALLNSDGTLPPLP